ncbi:c-type cytochrome [Pedobacter rhodius]|uniref:Cytochrome c n=1 Tax=Pedobacter rhodius TaxID=3004098 RepID=A0ABT4L171_9SPHI|nr:cytochrome c [Pedobacter sp. SJ11]MCZ4224928.1 cytochrome c [Pedobacter sp. SJ11]
MIIFCFVLLAVCCAINKISVAQFRTGVPGDSLKRVPKFGFGRTVGKAEIAEWDIDVRPDGKGLPAGKGDVETGRLIFVKKCTACHGAEGKQPPGVKLLGGVLVSDTLSTGRVKTIGNYWPYATTLFDYIRRAMPYNLPGSLSNDEVYALSAYLLHANKIIGQTAVIDAGNLPKIIMPARKMFVMDDRTGGKEIR